jgi:hypothetical protein
MQEFPSPCDAPSNQKKLTELTEDRKTHANFKSSARVAAVRTRAAAQLAQPAARAPAHRRLESLSHNRDKVNYELRYIMKQCLAPNMFIL